MATTKIGEMDFGDVGGNSNRGPRDEFMRMEPGMNVVRVITKPYAYLSHRVKKEVTDSYAKSKISCSMDPHGSCPLCEMCGEPEKTGVEKAKQRWYIGVLNRKGNKYQIMDVNFGVVNGIKSLVGNTHWGPVDRYDICITFDKSAPPISMYTVQGVPNFNPLTAEEQIIRDKALANVDNLLARCNPPEPAKVLERFNKLRQGTSADVANALAAARSGKTPAVVAAAVASDDDDDFPAYDPNH
jgi:hypothetical protein